MYRTLRLQQKLAIGIKFASVAQDPCQHFEQTAIHVARQVSGIGDSSKANNERLQPILLGQGASDGKLFVGIRDEGAVVRNTFNLVLGCFPIKAWSRQ